MMAPLFVNAHAPQECEAVAAVLVLRRPDGTYAAWWGENQFEPGARVP